MNLDSDLETPQSKVQKIHDLEQRRQLELALADITKKLQRDKTHGILLDSLRKQPDLSKQILGFQAAIQTAIHDATPFEPDRIVENVKHRLNYDNYELRDSAAEMLKGHSVARGIIQSVEENIMSRIHPRTPSEIKFGALSALCAIVNSIVSMEQGSEWADAYQTGDLPKALTSALMRVGKSLSDSEIDRVREDKELFATLKSAAEFEIEWLGKRPFEGLEEFQALFIDGSTVLDFRHCLTDVDDAFANDPLRSPRRGGRSTVEPSDDVLQEVVKRIITKDIFWKINRRTCFETKLNAFKVLTHIGHTFVKTRRGPHVEAFEDGLLEKTLTDTMLKICRLANDGLDDSTDVLFSFLADKEFIEDIMDLNIARKAALPDLSSVLRYLDIPDDASHSEDGPLKE